MSRNPHIDAAPFSVWVRPTWSNEPILVRPGETLELVRRGELHPVRAPRTYRRQQHYPGLYWSVTMGGHIQYESRLERTRVMIADRDPDVVAIIAQPLVFKRHGRGRKFSHVPDLLLQDRLGRLIVCDVKPKALTTTPKNSERLAFAQRCATAQGWEYQVWVEPSAARARNLDTLCCFRQVDVVDQRVVDLARSRAAACGTIGALEDALAAWADPADLRPAVLHLLWHGEIHMDLDGPLSRPTPIWPGRAPVPRDSSAAPPATHRLRGRGAEL